ncbi:hypothetical protein ACFPRL_34315 [Pseudoclavibacter helvolus]
MRSPTRKQSSPGPSQRTPRWTVSRNSSEAFLLRSRTSSGWDCFSRSVGARGVGKVSRSVPPPSLP